MNILMLRFLFFVYMDKINIMEENLFFQPGIIFFFFMKVI